jgi:hypothetical protein
MGYSVCISFLGLHRSKTMAGPLLVTSFMTTAHRTVIATLARVGFAVKGVLYLLLGGLALQFALGNGGTLTDPTGAVAALMQRPYGRPLAAIMAAGLGFYAAWRFLEAFADANNKGRDRKAISARLEYAFSGAVYTVLAVDAGILAFSQRRDGNVDLPATLTGSPLAEWLAMLVALGLVAYGGLQLWSAFRAPLSDRISHAQVERQIGGWALQVSRVGVAGRAVVLMLMGVVLLRRSFTSVDAAAQTDTGDSLRLLAALPTGGLLLVAVAAGLMAYGVFQLVHARYRRITPPG